MRPCTSGRDLSVDIHVTLYFNFQIFRKYIIDKGFSKANPFPSFYITSTRNCLLVPRAVFKYLKV